MESLSASFLIQGKNEKDHLTLMEDKWFVPFPTVFSSLFLFLPLKISFFIAFL